MRARCSRCHQATDVCDVRFVQVTGMLIMFRREIKMARVCARCAHVMHRSAFLHNVTLGWWSRMGIFLTPIFLIRNFNELRRASRAMKSPAPALPRGAAPAEDAFDEQTALALPWGHLLRDKPRAQGIGHRQLTWPTGIGAMAAFALVISLLMCIALSFGDGSNTPQQAATIRALGWFGLLFSSLTLAGCIYWQRRRIHRPDGAPDILGQTFPASFIFEVDRVHLASFACEVRGKLRLAIIAQNRHDGDTRLSLAATNANQTLPLDAPLQPGEVAIFYIRTRCHVERTGVATLHLSASTRGHDGALIRFAERTALRSEARAAAVALAMAAGGHIRLDSSGDGPGTLALMNAQGRLAVQVPPSVSGPLGGNWKKVTLWSAANQTTPAFAAVIFGKLIEGQSEAESAPV